MADNFYYVEGSCSVKNLVKTLVTEIVSNAGIYKWDLVYPASVDSIGAGEGTTLNLITDGSTTTKVDTVIPISGGNDKCILKATTTTGNIFYVKIDRLPGDLTAEEKKALIDFRNLHTFSNGVGTVGHRTDAEVLEVMAGVKDGTAKSGDYTTYVSAVAKGNSLTSMIFQISTKLNNAGDDLDIGLNTKMFHHRLAWYRNLASNIKDFLPVQYWINVTNDSINLVLRGDPSADVSPYDNYLTSYAYIGCLKPVEDSATTDDKHNFGITTSSEVQPLYSDLFGDRTATGVTDVCMIANKIGMPYQPHYPGFYATNPFMDKCNVEGSRWNHKKHQFSEITLVHPVDMERGKMINVMAGDASSIYDMDKLAYKKDTAEEEYYKKFKITAPYNFLNNSANINYCVAIRCYKTVE